MEEDRIISQGHNENNSSVLIKSVFVNFFLYPLFVGITILATFLFFAGIGQFIFDSPLDSLIFKTLFIIIIFILYIALMVIDYRVFSHIIEKYSKTENNISDSQGIVINDSPGLVKRISKNIRYFLQFFIITLIITSIFIAFLAFLDEPMSDLALNFAMVIIFCVYSFLISIVFRKFSKKIVNSNYPNENISTQKYVKIFFFAMFFVFFFPALLLLILNTIEF